MNDEKYLYNHWRLSNKGEGGELERVAADVFRARPDGQGKGKGKGKVKVGGKKKRPLIDVDVVEPKDKSLSSASTPLASSPPESSSMPAPIEKRPRRASAWIRSAA